MGHVERSNLQLKYPGNEGEDRRNMNDEKEPYGIGPDDTVYRYLCPLRKVGSIIGIGGDIAKQLRAQTNARIRISETIPGCDDRVITIFSVSDETNVYGDEHISPAQDALLRVYDLVFADYESQVNETDEPLVVTVRLLVPPDQIGCVIGKGGKVVQNIRSETHAQIRIFGSEGLPPCALSSDELIQITGEIVAVKDALYQVACCLHDNPSRSQQSLLSSPSIYRSGITFNNPKINAPFVGPTSLMGAYGNYNDGNGDWSSISKEFKLRLVCPIENLGAVIGKGGAVIKQIRQESGAYIIADSAGADENDCLISVSAKEMFEAPSRVVDGVMRLQQRCSFIEERESREPLITTRLLVSSPKIGCIIGKGGAIIKEMRHNTGAEIRIFSDEKNVPRIALDDDQMVQIYGDMNAVTNALLQVCQCLRTNVFKTDGSSSGFSLRAPNHPRSNERFNGPKYGSRDSRTRNPGHSNYSGGYNSQTLPQANNYQSYDGSQNIPGRSGYGTYAVSPDGHSAGTRSPNQNVSSSGTSYGH